METPYNFAQKKFYNSLYKIKNRITRIKAIKKLDYSQNEILLFVDTPREFYFRSHSYSKEPGTIQWLEKNCNSDTILYDVGANIGSYSLVAASLGSKVYAFEPAFQNFFQLNRNVTLNKFDELISTFPIALSVGAKINKFNYIETSIGTSKCYFNEKDQFHLNLAPTVKKDTLIYSLDALIEQFELPYPNLLKIDVDGGERDVIHGAQKTLSQNKLKSIMLEIDESKNTGRDLIDNILGHHFKLTKSFPFENKVSNFLFER